MKTKEQKRKEAIWRLERKPRWNGWNEPQDGTLDAIHQRRLAEAARLRAQFGLPPQDSASGEQP